MGNLVNKRISYIINQMQEDSFDFRQILDSLRTFISDLNSEGYLKVRFEFIYQTPDIEKIALYYSEGKIKSHEKKPIFDKIVSQVKSKISKLVLSLRHTADFYYLYKRNMEVEHNTSYEECDSGSKRLDKVTMSFNLKALMIEDITAILSLLEFEDISLCMDLRINTYFLKSSDSEWKARSSNRYGKKRIILFKKFLNLNDKERLYALYSEPNYFEALKTYMFPYKNKKAQITLDVFKEGLPPVKRRKVKWKGQKRDFFDIINLNTRQEDFIKIVKENLISGFYISVRSTEINEDCIYFIIDVDISNYLKERFISQVIWDFTMAISDGIREVFKDLGFPSPSINLSGGRGIHVILGMEENAIEDFEGKVNITPFYIYEKQLPGLSDLKKDKGSCMRNKFKFLKRIAQAISLKVIYHVELKIPQIIKKSLRIYRQYQLFKLSVDNKNEVSTLFDSSSLGRSVFRWNSAHLITKLISIPLFDLDREEYIIGIEDFKKVRELATIEAVKERINSSDNKLFLKRPNKISREMIDNLFLPHKLVPYFCIILRFDIVEATERGPRSFKFWFEFYQLQAFYNYLLNRIKTFNNLSVSPKTLISEIIDVKDSLRLKIYNFNRILDLVVQHLQKRLIEFPIFKERVETLYFIQFFFSMKSNIFIKNNEGDLLELFSDEISFSNFLSQTEKLVMMSMETLSALVLKKMNCSREQKETLANFDEKIDKLIEISRCYLDDLKERENDKRRSKRLIRTIHIVSLTYFTVLEFLRAFFKKNLENEKN